MEALPVKANPCSLLLGGGRSTGGFHSILVLCGAWKVRCWPVPPASKQFYQLPKVLIPLWLNYLEWIQLSATKNKNHKLKKNDEAPCIMTWKDHQIKLLKQKKQGAQQWVQEVIFLRGLHCRHIYLYIHTLSLEVEANKLGCQLQGREGKGREGAGQGTGVEKSLLYFILYLLNFESCTCIIYLK